MTTRSKHLAERYDDCAHDDTHQMTCIAGEAIAALRTAEDRIAELEARNGEQLLRSLTLVLRQYNDYGQISLEAIEEAEFEIKTAIAAGIGVKGE